MNSARPLLSSAVLAAVVAASALARADAGQGAPRPAGTLSEPTPAEPAQERTHASLAILYPLATNANRPEITSNADLSVLYGRVGQIEGAQVGGVVVQASRGVRGAQIGGVMSIAGAPATGLQLAGIANVAPEGVTGAQISGVLNLSGGLAVGSQTGVVNIANDVTGLQLGVVNVGGRVRGLQLGLVNVAEEADAAVGLVSISRDSVHPIAWASSVQYANVGVKFTSRYVFTLLGVHYGAPEGGFDDGGVTMALGGHVPLPAHFDLEVQGSLTSTMPWRDGSKDEANTWFSPQLVGGYSFAKHVRLFAGGGLRMPVTVHRGSDELRPELLAGIQL